MSNEIPKVDLDDQLVAYADRKVASGEFGSVSEVVQDALRQAQARDVRVERLYQLIREGVDSGPAEPFNFHEFLGQMRAEHKGAA